MIVKPHRCLYDPTKTEEVKMGLRTKFTVTGVMPIEVYAYDEDAPDRIHMKQDTDIISVRPDMIGDLIVALGEVEKELAA